MPNLAEWVIKLGRRLMALRDGTYLILLSKNGRVTWRVIALDELKTERG